MHFTVKKKKIARAICCISWIFSSSSPFWPLEISAVMINIPQGPKPEEQAAGGSGSVADAASSAQASSTSRVSDDKYRNYGVLAGLITGVGALGWYLLSKDKKAEEVQDWSIS